MKEYKMQHSMKIYYIFDNLEIHKIDDLKQEINIFISSLCSTLS